VPISDPDAWIEEWTDDALDLPPPRVHPEPSPDR